MTFMGMGGEKYSKEALDEAIKKEEDAKKPFKGSPGQYSGHKYVSGPFLEEHNISGQEVFEDALNFHNEYAKAAKERVDKLFKTAKKEATGMNNEYDTLNYEITQPLFPAFTTNKLQFSEFSSFHIL